MYKNYFIFFLLIFVFSCSSFSQDVSKFFPNNGEVSGWNRSGQIRAFAGDILWEYIDGGAEVYYIYGFKKVTTCDFKNQNKQIVIDIYEMKDAVNAFGIYSSERDPKYNYLKIGVQGYLEGTALNFWKSSYYIKITTFDKTPETKTALQNLAKAVDKKITGSSAEPDFLKYFPKNGMVNNSTKYFAKDILGHSFLYNGFMADYKDKSKIFILNAGNIKSAQNFFTAYKNYMNQSKAFEKDLKDIGNGAFSGKDAGRKVYVFYNSKMMGGVLSLNDESKAVKILQELSKK
jgi:hypothetical protein